MLTATRILTWFIIAIWLTGCATEPEAPAVSATPAPSYGKKKERRYLHFPMDTAISPQYKFPKSARSIDQALYTFAPAAIDQLKPYFKKAGVSYPPQEIVLIAIKDEKKMELWARDFGPFKLIRPYTIKAASGMRGPKLKQGDRQVPEGIYDFDREHAQVDGRSDLGGDIFIHGKSVSAGCLARGDAAIEELFVLAAHVGTDNIKVVIAPSDPRLRPLDTTHHSLPYWTGELYDQVTREIFTITQAKPPVKLAHSHPSHPIYRPVN